MNNLITICCFLVGFALICVWRSPFSTEVKRTDTEQGRNGTNKLEVKAGFPNTASPVPSKPEHPTALPLSRLTLPLKSAAALGISAFRTASSGNSMDLSQEVIKFLKLTKPEVEQAEHFLRAASTAIIPSMDDPRVTVDTNPQSPSTQGVRFRFVDSFIIEPLAPERCQAIRSKLAVDLTNSLGVGRAAYLMAAIETNAARNPLLLGFGQKKLRVEINSPELPGEPFWVTYKLYGISTDASGNPMVKSDQWRQIPSDWSHLFKQENVQ